jgi:hypothetical protein
MFGRVRVLAALLVSAVIFSCVATTPPSASEQPTAAVATPVPSPTPPPPLRPARTVGTVGEGVAASGDFRGSGKSQIALLQDPARNSSVRITVRDPNGDGDTFAESVWLTTPPGTIALIRAKLAVADVNSDGKDDLVALYDSGNHTSSLLVFTSTGTAFEGPNAWWKGDDYVWSRARNLLSGKFGANDRDSLLVTYQNGDSDMRVHSFESTGTAFAFGGTQGVYDSGRGQFDASRARFAVGHFTRTGGADQIAAFYQYPGAKVRLNIFDPSPSGLVLTTNVFESAENEYDLGRATISAADVTGDGKDDLVSIYGQPDGSGTVHVFDSGSSFKPSNGYSGWASFPAASVCAGATGVIAGDWNSDRKVDIHALTPGDGTQVRTNLLRNMGGGFRLTSTAEETVCPRWPLTGMPLGTGSATKRPLYVKIDNNAHARPHYGISKADQVYEWLVEGLTTRLAAVFQSQDPGVIGSVRSARMTDTPIVPSLDAAFVYSGGGPIELMGLHYDSAVAHRYVDLSPSFGWGYRVGFREAPYNYFTTYAALRGALAAAEDGDQPAIVPSWDFLPPSATDPLAGGLTGSVAATTITIPYRAGFAVRYAYNPAARSYTRYDDGVREIDPANGEVVAARNIVVIQTEVHFTTEFGLDPAGSPKLDMQLTGTGHGSVFRDGKRQDVTWTRPDVSDVFRLTNASGEAVRLVPGQTWIHIVPADWSIPSQ